MSRISSTYKKISNNTLGSSKITNQLYRSHSFGNLRKNGTVPATTTSLKFSKNSTKLTSIENEYIKNLQQQVYFLELEAQYLREQAQKASDLHPAMKKEAEGMLQKLRSMQIENDSLRLEIRRLESSVGLAQVDEQRANDTLKSVEERYLVEKRSMMDEILNLKKSNEILDLENSQKESALNKLETDYNRTFNELKDVEREIIHLKSQISNLKDELSSKDTNLVQAQRKNSDFYNDNTALRQDKNYLTDQLASLQQTLDAKDKHNMQLQAEVNLLKRKLHHYETEISLEEAVQANRWQELDRMTETMRSLSRSMATRSPPLSARYSNY